MNYTQAFDIAAEVLRIRSERGYRHRDGVVRAAALAAVKASERAPGAWLVDGGGKSDMAALIAAADAIEGVFADYQLPPLDGSIA